MIERVTFGVEVNSVRVEFTMELDSDFAHDRFLLQHHQRNACYEPEVARVLMRTLKPGDAAVDVGANVGFFTLMMAALVGPTGDVTAFEPIASTVKRLNSNLELNARSNVEIVEAPVWSKQEEVSFYVNSDDAAGSSLWDPGLWPHNSMSRASPMASKQFATTLDLETAKYPKVIKIDAEGAEQHILAGAECVLKHGAPPYVIVELNPFGMEQLKCTTEALRSLMRSHNYDMFFLHGDDRMPTLVPPATKVLYHNGIVVKNAMFSTLDAVAKAWPEAVE